jgi:acetyl esterase
MAEGFGLSLDGLRWFWEQYLQGQVASALAAPALAADHAGLPPALVMTAQYDVLRDEGEHYASVLKRAGNDVDLKRYEGMTHGFLAFSGLIDEAEKALEDAALWLRSRFGARYVERVTTPPHHNNQRSLEDL